MTTNDLVTRNAEKIMKMYRTNSWNNIIDEVDVVRRTPAFVYIMRNGRERRESSLNYFETRENAVKAKLLGYEKIVASLLSSLEYAQNNLNEAKKTFEMER